LKFDNRKSPALLTRQLDAHEAGRSAFVLRVTFSRNTHPSYILICSRSGGAAEALGTARAHGLGPPAPVSRAASFTHRLVSVVPGRSPNRAGALLEEKPLPTRISLW